MTGVERPRRARGRITRSGDFDAVYQRGRSAASRHIVVYTFQRSAGDHDAPPRLGLSISRKVGGAVERNRVKRVIRAQFGRLAPGLPRGSDWVVIGRPGVAEYVAERGGAALGERLAELTARLVAQEAPT